MARLPAALVAAGVAVAALAPTVHGAPPANDDWGNAPGLSAPDTTLATNVDATLEPGDNYWSDWTWRGIVGDVWFKWTASVTGWAAFKTTNPDYEGQPNVDTIVPSVTPPATALLMAEVFSRSILAFHLARSNLPLVVTDAVLMSVCPSPLPDESQDVLAKNWIVKVLDGVLLRDPLMVVEPLEMTAEELTGKF